MEYAIYLGMLALGAVVGFLAALLKSQNSKSGAAIKQKLEVLNIEFASQKSLLHKAELELENCRKEIVQLRDLKEQKASLASRLQAEKEGLENKLLDHSREVEKMQDRLAKDFQVLANKILEEKSDRFTKQNKLQISELLDPLREKIVDFQKKVEETNKDSIRQNSSLITEIRQLKDLNQQITREAENLTKALKGSSKTQGNWGEMILERILENSGLEKDREYTIQESITNSEGRRLQPDVLIKLPEDKCIVIDAKVSLLAYERYTNEEDELQMAAHLRNHLLSVKSHIKSLCEKRYQDLHGIQGLDFILMFVPIEPAFMLAMQKDHEMFNEAYGKGIILVSPSTLIASLKIIAASWKHEHQNQNALEIARQGGELFKKFVSFTDDMLKIGDQLSKTQNTYSEAMNKLKEGKGNLVSRAQNLENLGIKASRQLHPKLSEKTSIIPPPENC